MHRASAFRRAGGGGALIESRLSSSPDLRHGFYRPHPLRPSPTGYLHYRARTALFPVGLRLPRQPCTSSCASRTPTWPALSPEAVQAILDGMSWLDLNQ